MQLVFEHAQWEAITKWGEQAAPKAAGFKCDPSIQRWHSTDVLAALKLRDFADAATAAKLDADVVAAKAAKQAKDIAAAVAVAASRAQDADVELPIAAGRAFLPYQKAGIAYALARPNCLLGDDMGLGKTAQAIGTIC